MNGLAQWKRHLEADLREKKLALARARQASGRAEQIERALLDERERRDVAEREQRARGELLSFARERMDVLLERALARAGERVAAARLAETDAAGRLREAWQRVKAIERLTERQAERAGLEAARRDQKELDEIALRRRLQFLAATPAGPGDPS